jgi:hypothetical protein
MYPSASKMCVPSWALTCMRTGSGAGRIHRAGFATEAAFRMHWELQTRRFRTACRPPPAGTRTPASTPRADAGDDRSERSRVHDGRVFQSLMSFSPRARSWKLDVDSSGPGLLLRRTGVEAWPILHGVCSDADRLEPTRRPCGSRRCRSGCSPRRTPRDAVQLRRDVIVTARIDIGQRLVAVARKVPG